MFEEIVDKYAAQFNVPALWIQAVIQTESSFNPRAYREEPKINDASYGLMQLLSSTAKGLGFNGSAEDLYDPDTNIYYGTKLLSQLIRSYGLDARKVYSAYNSGKPDGYVTSTQVAEHVRRFVSNLEDVTTKFVDENPVKVAAGGALAGVLFFLILWKWGLR